MDNSEDSLIKRLKKRLSDPKRFIDVPAAFPYKIYPPVSPDELAQAEHTLGFHLPPLLQQLYLKVGNGGFGPGFGLFALNDKGAQNYHMNLVDGYREGINFAEPDYPAWPRKFLVICDWGDGITSALKWTDVDVPVFRVRGDRYEGGPWEAVLVPEAASLHAWLEDWLSNRPLAERLSL